MGGPQGSYGFFQADRKRDRSGPQAGDEHYYLYALLARTKEEFSNAITPYQLKTSIKRPRVAILIVPKALKHLF